MNVTALLGILALCVTTTCSADPRWSARATADLLEAVQFGDAPKAVAALKHRANPNATYEDGAPVLVCAVERGGDGILRKLLDQGAKINNRGPGGETALMVAAAKANASAVQLLLLRGARANLRSSRGSTALSLCREKNLYPSGSLQADREILRTIRLLRRAGAN